MNEVRQASIDALIARPPAAIVLGGSAGGIDALKALLPALPPRLGIPVLVVIHLAHDTRADWSLLFAGTSAPVREAEDKDVAEPGTVYMAPPHYHLLVDRGGRLQLSVEAQVQFARPSIDVLFESAAWAYADRLLAVVLSGANADGAKGLAAVVRAGGQAWVQAPEQATASMMPRAALEAAPSALALGLDDMVHVLGSGALPSRPTVGNDA